MKPHLTDRHLIDYEFKLAPDHLIKTAAAHLAGCPQCRTRLDRIKHKFASLDLLRQDVKVSDELISSVMAALAEPRRRTLFFARPIPLGASAAAVLILGLLLLFASPWVRKPAHKPEIAEKLTSAPPVRAAEPPSAGGRAVGYGYEEGAAKLSAVVMKDKALAPAGRIKAAVSDEPPFAPASAIELVTLPRRENVQLTIYNSADLTLVREHRNITLKQGWNWLQFMWANTLIDPTSLCLEPLKDAGKVEIQQLVFPPRLRELGRWLIRSEVTGQVPFEITYFTSGLSWRAFYMGTLSRDEKTMHLEGYVRVGNSSGEDYENAQTRLIVGQVHLLDQIAALAGRRYPYGSPVPVVGGALGEFNGNGAGEKGGRVVWGDAYGNAPMLDLEIGKLARKEIRKEGLSEYFLYTIEGTETVPDKWGKRLLSLDVKDIAVKSLYKYDEERWGQQTMTFVAFANDKDHNLGETPIPNGNVKVYTLADEQGHLSYVGGAEVKYIPVGEEVELDLGPARLVRVEPLLMDFKTENHVFDRNNDVAGWDEVRTWRIEVTNTRTLPVEFEITRSFDTAYWMLRFDQQGVSYKKHDATHTRFTLTLEPRAKRTFEYAVRTAHGTREEIIAKSQEQNR